MHIHSIDFLQVVLKTPVPNFTAIAVFYPQKSSGFKHIETTKKE